MIDHIDMLQFLKAVSALKNKHLRPPTTAEIADALFMSRGAVEHRVKLLREAGILKKAETRTNTVIIEGEMYMPPVWMQKDDQSVMGYIYDRLSDKRQRNSR